MALALRAWAINRGGKNSVRNLRYGPRTRLVRGIYQRIKWNIYRDNLKKCFNRSGNRIGGFHMTSHKFKLLKILILQKFYFRDVWEQLKTNIHTNFRSEWVLGFMIDDAWFQCVTWQLHDGHKSCHVALKSNLFRGIWPSEQSRY